jgi:hypothetical protein
MRRTIRLRRERTGAVRASGAVQNPGLVVLIFEGADKAGKTTLARHYAAAVGCGIVTLRWELADPTVEARAFARATAQFLGALDGDVVLDRTYLSWGAYGPALGHDVSFMEPLIAGLSTRGLARLVLCTASAAELRDRREGQGDSGFPLDATLWANERFPSLLALLPDTLPALHLDTTDSGADESVARIDDFLARAASGSRRAV